MELCRFGHRGVIEGTEVAITPWPQYLKGPKGPPATKQVNNAMIGI